MSDGPESLTLRMLRSMDAKLDRVLDETREIKGRVSLLEQQYAAVQRRIDRIDDRMDRIERRLDLTEGVT